MSLDLFTATHADAGEQIGAGTWLFRQRALPEVAALAGGLRLILAQAPWRHLITPGGHRMAVAMTNCGTLGWHSDEAGYRYQPVDPLSGHPWPAMPPAFAELARQAAALAGYPDFHPDACLINRYRPGAGLSLHQDRNEQDHGQPVVSVSLGMEARFLWGGLQRGQTALKLPLYHGDILVWGGPDRLRFHGIAPLQGPPHPEWGLKRINLTFRRAR
ncbi:DNA oxidative demethylase AlkB [Frateuria aurantia]|uniref:Alkylated DNA repair protein n=1 Tax=Frateuria aurantia (strain ATCC 33424 / DSM 6220 / KCTC 2777 / LMG 1558 / NBRC 3245 / NCIMB 13370) TaxID=767434 RepID=H8L489_FRAAD|nr:DNA oxidative demethylase AlkB [Frateuria aurantia]AFC86565.1 alkylated DNA repair protein [Frateuria aurantia DSM 6220]